MDKKEIIKAISKETGNTRLNTYRMVESILENIGEELYKGEKVELLNFGTFEVQNRAAWDGMNPRTRERVIVPATKMPSFKASKFLRIKVREGY